MTPASGTRCVALSGGVGGAKLALGLAQVLDARELTIIANIGDDFEHLGLHVSPDLDTLMYVLAGLDNPETGWGRAGETWSFMEALGAFGGETWFRLGDRDLATHVERTWRLRAGETLSEVTATLCARLGVQPRILPMSDDPVRTLVRTPQGDLPFQHYFVRERCAPRVTGFTFQGAEAARAHPAFLDALRDPRLGAVVVCPSNPFISIDPILSLPGVRAALAAAPAPVVAVSPIIGGAAIKGPTAKMMRELDMPTTALAVARHYGDLLDGFVLDRADAMLAGELEAAGSPATVTNAVMVTLEDRAALARTVLDFAARIDARSRGPGLEATRTFGP